MPTRRAVCLNSLLPSVSGFARPLTPPWINGKRGGEEYSGGGAGGGSDQRSVSTYTSAETIVYPDSTRAGGSSTCNSTSVRPVIRSATASSGTADDGG